MVISCVYVVYVVKCEKVEISRITERCQVRKSTYYIYYIYSPMVKSWYVFVNDLSRGFWVARFSKFVLPLGQKERPALSEPFVS